MYLEWEASPGAPPIGLPMTPSVALRTLHAQIESYWTREIIDPEIDLYMHFDGHVRPPRPGTRRPVGDPVFDTISNYASMIAGRENLLVVAPNPEPVIEVEETDRTTRVMFALEHSLAIDLSRNYPDSPLTNREAAARATLALAAFWCDRKELTGLRDRDAHPLLGTRPNDAIGAVLYDFAVTALASPQGQLGPVPVIHLEDLEAI